MIPQVLRESGYNLVFVEADGSHGLHNADYAIQLLQQSIKKLTGSLPAVLLRWFPGDAWP